MNVNNKTETESYEYKKILVVIMERKGRRGKTGNMIKRHKLRRVVKTVEWEDMGFTSPHKYMKNTSTN